MDDTERRIFPRINVVCPVLYRLDKAKSWKVARMCNFSATGIQFVCAEAPTPTTAVSIHVKPGSKKNIPELIANGSVLRIDKISDQKFLLSCQLTKVSSS